MKLLQRITSMMKGDTYTPSDEPTLRPDTPKESFLEGDFVRWKGCSREDLLQGYNMNPQRRAMPFEQYAENYRKEMLALPNYGRVMWATKTRMAVNALAFHNVEYINLVGLLHDEWWKLYGLPPGNQGVEEYTHVNSQEVMNHLGKKLITFKHLIDLAKASPEDAWTNWIKSSCLPRFYHEYAPNQTEMGLVGCIQARKMFRLAEVCQLLLLEKRHTDSYPLYEMRARPNTGVYVIAATELAVKRSKPKQVLVAAKYSNTSGVQLDERGVAHHIGGIYPNWFSDAEDAGYFAAFEIPTFALDLVKEIVEINVPAPSKIKVDNSSNLEIRALELADRLLPEKKD